MACKKIKKTIKIITSGLLIGSIFISNFAAAKPVTRKSFVMELGQVTFDAQTAKTEGVEDSANFFRFAYGQQKKSVVYSLGFSGFMYKDNESFKQDVVDQSGNQSTADTSTGTFNAYAEGGYILKMHNSFNADLLAGYEQVLQSSRSIPNCTNCSSEDIKIKAGVYVSSRLGYEWNNGFKMSLSYRQYISGDVENALALNSIWHF